MTDEQLEIIKEGMEKGIPLRQTIIDEGWVEKLSPETVRPVRKAFINKYGNEEFRRLIKIVHPSLGTGIVNAAKAAKRAAKAVLKGDKVFVDRATKMKRLETCLGCPLLSEKGDEATCSMCKCNVRKKVGFATEECPAGKWKK
jgi:hypothetical protein